MYRLLIVDDEPHIIEGLKRMVNWEQYGIYQIETAVNYHDAIAKAIEYKPDIAIFDGMPFENLTSCLATIIEGKIEHCAL